MIRKMSHQDLTGKIIGAAYAVHNRMGFGFLESVYSKCLLIELGRRKIEARRQAPIRVFYEGCLVGEFIADLLVERLVVVELKSVQTLHQAHEVQLVNYLVATQMNTGLLLNFGPKGVDVKRKFRNPLPAPRV